MNIKVLKKDKIKKKLKIDLCKLKKSFWKYSLKSHVEWFDENVRKNDINILLLNKGNLIGYNLLRKRNYYFTKNKNKKKNYFYFDTLIVRKEFRKKNLSKKILNKSINISRKSNLPLILICKKQHVSFYKKFSFKLLKKNNIKFMDHRFNSYSMIYAKKNSKYLISNKIQIYLT
tara:strand:+ start:2062 stop:2583 length:522 start_codon:yes stop_codon:yes gene_type:complete